MEDEYANMMACDKRVVYAMDGRILNIESLTMTGVFDDDLRYAKCKVRPAPCQCSQVIDRMIKCGRDFS